MSKKNVFLILVIVAFLTIMAISVWGKKPEFSNRVVVTNITVLDENNNEIEKCNDLIKVKPIEKKYTDEITTYTLSVYISPMDATDKSVSFDIISGSNAIEIRELDFSDWVALRNNDTDTFKENYHYYRIDIKSKDSFTICFSSNPKDTVKKAYIKFTWSGTRHDDIIDI